MEIMEHEGVDASAMGHRSLSNTTGAPEYCWPQILLPALASASWVGHGPSRARLALHVPYGEDHHLTTDGNGHVVE